MILWHAYALAQSSHPEIAADADTFINTYRRQRPAFDADPVVFTDLNAHALWVSSEFSQMCGYSLAELRGNSLGPLLQREATDKNTVAVMRNAIAQRKPCNVEILNYHKDGHPYWVRIVFAPVQLGSNYPGFVAVEREVPGEGSSRVGVELERELNTLKSVWQACPDFFQRPS